MNIGFDLDGIFIATPPAIPPQLIEWLYKDHTHKNLFYRIPGKIEQQIRFLSHHPTLRPLKKTNFMFLKNLVANKSNKLFLISSRFGFLESRTKDVIERYSLSDIFTHMYFNFRNEQPHFFKKDVLTLHHLDTYVDDDLPLLVYLAKQFPKTTFFWLNSRKRSKLTDNLFAVTNISEIIT